MSGGLEELVAVIDAEVVRVVRELNNPALNAVPLDLLSILCCRVCTVGVATSIAQQFDLMHEADQAAKQ